MHFLVFPAAVVGFATAVVADAAEVLDCFVEVVHFGNMYLYLVWLAVF